MIKRLFDITFSVVGIFFLMPLFLIISVLIKFNSKGNIFFVQTRVGKDNKDFNLFKFRTMYKDADKNRLITVGKTDPRIMPLGVYLRKYKLDEFPQLFNILKGDMSFVGPRPEVRKYVMRYNENQLKVLEVKPGITDLASIIYRNEADLLDKSSNPEEYYIQEILPNKLNLNLNYLSNRSLMSDLEIILKTLKVIIFN